MALSETYIAQLLLKKLTGDLTAEESAALETWAQSSPAAKRKFDELTSLPAIRQKLKDYAEASERSDQLRSSNLMIAPDAETSSQSVPGSSQANAPARIPLIRKLSWAAAIILIAVGIYTWSVNNRKQNPTTTTRLSDIPPGKNTAILTLSDGSAIVLDSSSNGVLATQGNTRILKNATGRITYTPNNTTTDIASLDNTLSTPKGGQYQLTLPDGSNVWLNAASSITFPTAFTGSQRHVTITGEAWFEVAKDNRHPFIVDIKDAQSVEVLGTEFNINGYDNEAQIRTTLIKGSIKIAAIHRPGTAAASHQSNVPPATPAAVILKPGQQAILASTSRQTTANTGITTIDAADIEKIMAWKKGLFNFEGADVPTVMRQLERWYDIHVKYNGAIPDIRFRGELDRGVNLSEILKILPEMGIRYRLEDRTLIVL
jgi:ferric-dicitrate binding protein FerR (iron transport regulator)